MVTVQVPAAPAWWRETAALIDNVWKDEFEPARSIAYFAVLGDLDPDAVREAVLELARRGGGPNCPGAAEIAGEARALMQRPKPAQRPGPRWAQLVDELRSRVPEPTFDTWLQPLQFGGFHNDRLVLLAPAECRAWLADRFHDLLQAAAREVLGPDVTVVVLEASTTPTVVPQLPHQGSTR